jgi:hypothetical protein
MWLRAFVAAAATLVLVLGALLVALVFRNAGEVRSRVLRAFRRPEPAALPPPPDHYYRHYWS